MAAISASEIEQKWSGGSAWGGWSRDLVYAGYDNTAGRNYAACIRVRMPGAGIAAQLTIAYRYAYGTGTGPKFKYRVTSSPMDEVYRNPDASAAADGTVNLVQGNGTFTASWTEHFSAGAYLYVYVWAGSGTGVYSQGEIRPVSAHTCTYTEGTPSEVTASGQYAGSPVVISVTRDNPGFTHTLLWSFEGGSGTIASGVETSCRWTPPVEALAPRIPSAVRGTCTITCVTYQGSAQVGSRSTSLTLTLPASVKPAVSAGWYAASRAGTGLESGYLQGCSRLKVTFDGSKVSCPYGASRAKFKVTLEGKTYETAGTEITTEVFRGAGTISYSAAVTDSRGRETVQTGTVTVLSYAPPVITNHTVFRCDGGGQASGAGAFVSVTAEASCSSAGGANSLSLTARYRASGGAFGEATALTSGTAALLGGSLSPASSYVVQIRAEDTVGNSDVKEITIPTDEAAFHIREGGRGAAFFGYAQTDGELTVNGRIHPTGGIYMPVTYDVLADAEAMAPATVRFFLGGGARYTGVSPGSRYNYGTFLVLKRSATYIQVAAFPYHPDSGIALNGYFSGKWNGWKQFPGT